MKKEFIQKIIITEGPFTSARNKKKKKKGIDRILLCKTRSYNCLVHWVWKMLTMLSLKCISMYVEVQNQTKLSCNCCGGRRREFSVAAILETHFKSET